MVDFKKFLSMGLSAAERAAANKNEIASVFEELNQQLDEATDGKIFISRVDFYENNAFVDISAIASFKPREKYTAIAAANKKIEDCNYKELARWRVDRNGYPCSIILDGDEMYCEDKVALEKSLQRLLSDPVVGEILHKLMSMQPDNDIDNAEDSEDA